MEHKFYLRFLNAETPSELNLDKFTSPYIPEVGDLIRHGSEFYKVIHRGLVFENHDYKRTVIFVDSTPVSLNGKVE